MDVELRDLERKVREGNTDALAPYAQACVRAQKNMYEFLPLFVENRRNAGLRRVLNDAGLLWIQQYCDMALLELDDRVTPSGNVIAFNQLMNNYPDATEFFTSSESVRVTKTPNNHLKYTFMKPNGACKQEIDLSEGTIRDSPNPKLIEFIFGNLTNTYLSRGRIIQNRNYRFVPNFGGSAFESVLLQLNLSFILQFNPPNYTLNITARNTQNSAPRVSGVTRQAADLLSPPSEATNG